jgi:hypothetical protein
LATPSRNYHDSRITSDPISKNLNSRPASSSRSVEGRRSCDVNQALLSVTAADAPASLLDISSRSRRGAQTPPRASFRLAIVPGIERPAASQSGAPEPAQTTPGISELIGRVLDQLQVSAWLPAVMLVGIGALLVQVHSQQHLDVGAAVVNLTKQPLGILIVLLFALILATMITQAFGFGAIRFLEGYWGTSRLAIAVAKIRIAAHVKRRAKLESTRLQLSEDAFDKARKQMLREKVKREVIDILEDIVYRRSLDDYTADKRRKATRRGWRRSADPADLRKLDTINKRRKSYPEPHRILPTRLGNTLRAIEDNLTEADRDNIQGFVMRHYDKIHPRLLTRHTEHRTRLDMYCTLVFVFALLVPADIILLWKFGPWHSPALGGALLLVLLAYVSYRAALASADGYGTALLEINAQVKAAKSATSDDPNPATEP